MTSPWATPISSLRSRNPRLRQRINAYYYVTLEPLFRSSSPLPLERGLGGEAFSKAALLPKQYYGHGYTLFNTGSDGHYHPNGEIAAAHNVYDYRVLQLCSIYIRNITVVTPITISNISGYSSKILFMDMSGKLLQYINIIRKNENELSRNFHLSSLFFFTQYKLYN